MTGQDLIRRLVTELDSPVPMMTGRHSAVIGPAARLSDDGDMPEPLLAAEFAAIARPGDSLTIEPLNGSMRIIVERKASR